MNWRRLCAIVLTAIAGVSCGGSSPPPGSSDPGDTGERITGSERLGWNQAASDASELANFAYAAYVDGNRNVLSGVSCTNAQGGSFQCSSRMPAMSPGSHTLELASFVTESGTTVESERSSPFRVTLASATAGAEPAAPSTATEHTTLDGVRLRAAAVAGEVESPTAIAFAPDGTLFLAERQGRVRIMALDRLGTGGALTSNPPALTLENLYLPSSASGGLIDLALDPAFERTRYVYALYVVADRDGAPRFQIARLREAARSLGERVVLFDDLAASPERPSGALSFGPDGKLYAAFDDAGEPARARQASAYNGKILRLNADGTTPTDQPAGSPVFSSDYRSPRGLEWHPASGALWVTDVRSPDTEHLRIVEASLLQPGGVRLSRAPDYPRIVLPKGTAVAAMAFYRGGLLAAFDGDLFVAGGEGLLRVRFDRQNSVRLLSTERIFPESVGGVLSVAVAPDGSVFYGVERALMRIGPG